MKSFYHYVTVSAVDACVNGFERLSNRVGNGSVLHRFRERILSDEWVRFLYLTFLFISINPFLLLFNFSATLVLLINVLLIVLVGGSYIFRNLSFAQNSLLGHLMLANGKFLVVFVAIMLVSALSITRIALVTEMIQIALFLAMTLGQPRRGLYLFALTLPILTYRPLLVFILIIVLMLIIVKPDFELAKRNLKNHLNLAVFLFVAMLFITAILSVNWQESMTEFVLYYFVSFILYLLIVVMLTDRESLQKFLWLLIVSTALISIYGIYQYLTLEFTSTKWIDASNNPGITKRIYATFGNPNIFGQYLVMILPLNTALLLYSKLWRHRLALAFMLALSFGALLLTYSRGSWVAIALAVIVLVTMISRRLLVIGFILAAVGVGANLLPASIMTRIQSIVDPSQDSSSGYRLDMWNSALAMIRDFWKTGIGSDPTTFFKVYADYMMPAVRVFHFHNIYLMTMVTGGILLFGALMYMFYQACRTVVVGLAMNASAGSWRSYVIKGAMAALIAIAAAGMTEDIWRQYRVDFMFWVVLAVIAATYNLIRNVYEEQGSSESISAGSGLSAEGLASDGYDLMRNAHDEPGFSKELGNNGQ